MLDLVDGVTTFASFDHEFEEGGLFQGGIREVTVVIFLWSNNKNSLRGGWTLFYQGSFPFRQCRRLFRVQVTHVDRLKFSVRLCGLLARGIIRRQVFRKGKHLSHDSGRAVM